MSNTNGSISSATMNGHADGEVHQPRARKPFNPSVAALNDELKLEVSSAPASGRATPAPPEDAPPSVKATSAVRRELRQQSKRRMFPTIEYESRLSYFDPNSDYGNFRGFFVLFWIGLAIMVITAMLRNLKETGSLLNFRQWPLFTENIYELAISDLLMCASTALSLPLHKMYRNSRGWLRWSRGGIVVQSLFQLVCLVHWCSWPFVRDWTWTAQVFFTLHLLAMFMKMHSYAFYNGHLSNTFNRLKELDQPITAQTPTTAAVRYPSTYTPLADTLPSDLSQAAENETTNISPIVQLREDLAKELTSPMGRVTYPQNLTAQNYWDYLLCPTLCYELEYPRTPRTNPIELFWKTLAVFGCIFLLTITSEEFILPVLENAQLSLSQESLTLPERGLIFAETVSRLLFPFMITFLLVFLVIFEYVLGAFAEITRFADRRFYSDWWNSSDWLEFSREWNIPVHHFFRRHVYSASRSIVKGNKGVATVITFLISALAHELVMGCITRKFRGYGFFMMMLQIPIVTLQRVPWVHRKALLNNVLFWCSMILGLSLMCALYVLV